MLKQSLAPLALTEKKKMMEYEEVDKSRLPGFVYLLMYDGRDYKVGLTGDITKRLTQE